MTFLSQHSENTIKERTDILLVFLEERLLVTLRERSENIPCPRCAIRRTGLNHFSVISHDLNWCFCSSHLQTRAVRPPVGLWVLERDFPPLLARRRCAVTLFRAGQEWHHPLRANCTDSQPTQRGLFIDVSGPPPHVYGRAKFVFILPGPTVSTHGSRNNIPCGGTILCAKERTARLTSQLPLQSMLVHTQAGTDTLKNMFELVYSRAHTHTHIQLDGCCHTCPYTHTHMQTQTYIRRLHEWHCGLLFT